MSRRPVANPVPTGARVLPEAAGVAAHTFAAALAEHENEGSLACTLS